MTHPGVGPITALATEVFLGDPARFADSKELANYVGMIPGEYFSGKRQRLGGLTKQGNPLLRFICSEAAIHAVRRDPELKHLYRRKLIQKGLGKARAAVARTLGIRMCVICGIGLSKTSSAVVDRCSKKVVMPVRGCQQQLERTPSSAIRWTVAY
jgi:transposase